MSDNNIKVAIRVRPLIARELENNANIYWKATNKKTVSQVKDGSSKFYFDRVFRGEEKNHDVYKDLCQPIVKSLVQGFNGTIFAYGQTSSGKTFTMMGEHGGIYKGVIQYTIEDIFDMIQQMQDREFLLRISVIEIYNEKVYDLLSSKNEDLKLLEDCYGVIKVNGLQEKIVQNADQIWDIMHEGQTKRKTGQTEMNRVSSRSHFIFRMILESSLKGEEDPAVNVSQLNLVDLAGSENIRQTKSKGQQFKEGVHINLSLSTLSQVISQLSEKPDQFINYRDSKLTRLLQNSLGGNAVTAIICAVTPATKIETLSTLNFASRAKKIKNKPEKNEILTDQALLKQYANKIKNLSQQLEVSKAQGKELEEKTKQNESLKRQIETLKANFVSQTAESKAKATRRETWGGHLDSKRFFEPRNTPFYQLPQIMEEIEDPNEAFFSESKERLSKESSRYSRSSASFSSNQSLNNVANIGIQTDLEWIEQNENIEDAMTLISEFKSQLNTLKSEFEELSEYTTLEKQCLKAENELQVEIQALRNENSILKQILEKYNFPIEELQGYVSDSLKKQENIVENKLLEKQENILENKLLAKQENIVENKRLENIDHEQDQETFDSNSVAERLNDSLQSQKVISPKRDTTVLDNTTSTVFDESKFLAFYDECVENENEDISKLKAEIESLKYDIEKRDKQISLLNDKVSIKDQFITSLQDEIALGKNKVHQNCQTENDRHTPVRNVFHTECQTTPNKCCETCSRDATCSYINKSPAKSNNISHLKLEKSIQTSPIFVPDLSNFSPNHLVNDIEVKSINADQFTQITPVKSTDFGLQFSIVKTLCEQYVQTSPSSKLLSKSDANQCTQMGDSILEENNENFILEEKSVRTFIPQSSQTEELYEEYECNKSNNNCTETKEEKSIQTSPIFVPDLSNFSPNHLVNDIEVKSINADQFTQITPVKSTDFGLQFSIVKTLCEQYVQTSPSSKLLSKSDTNQCTQMGDSILEENNENFILEEKSVKTFIPQSSQTEELYEEYECNKIIVKKMHNLKIYTINILKSCAKTEYLRPAGDFEHYVNDDCSVSIHDELTKLEKLIMTLEYYIKNRDDDCDVVNNMLESKFQDMLSLQSKLSEAENFLNAKESELSGICTMFCDLKQYLSQLTHVYQVLNYVESRSKMYNIESDTILSNGSNSCKAGYDIKLLKKLFFKLNSEMEENASKIVSLSDDLEKIKSEMAAVEKGRDVKSLRATKSTQTCDAGESEKDQEMLKLIKEIKYLKEENAELEQSNNCLQQKNENLLNSQSEILDSFENIKSEKSVWEIKTKMLVNDLEAKYEKELNDQDKELHERISFLKADHAQQVISLKEKMDKMKDSYENELCEIRRQYENQLSSVNSEKENLEHELKKKHYAEMEALRAKYSSKISKCKEINIQLKEYVQQYKEEIEKLKEENPCNDSQVVQQLNKKITDLSSERDSLKRRCTAADQQISGLKEQINNLERKMNHIDSNSKEHEQIKRKLLYDLDQKKAKIMTLESNNASMLQEVKKLKEMLSSKSNDENKDKDNGKSKINGIDGAATNQALKKSSHDDFETPKQKPCAADLNCMCIGGGSGQANMVKNYLLEGMIRKKDKEISKLKEELTELHSQLKIMKSRPHITEDRETEVKKTVKPKLPVFERHNLKVSNSPLQERDENITVQMSSHPYQDTIPHVQKKQNPKERNVTVRSKPYEKRLEQDKKENLALAVPNEEGGSAENMNRNITKYDVVRQLTDPECKQQ